MAVTTTPTPKPKVKVSSLSETAATEVKEDSLTQSEVPPAVLSATPPPSVSPTDPNEILRRIEQTVVEHLDYLRRCPVGTVTVLQFAEFFGTGSNTNRILQQYVDQGYVVRTWKRSAGRYSLTPAGEAYLAEVEAR